MHFLILILKIYVLTTFPQKLLLLFCLDLVNVDDGYQ